MKHNLLGRGKNVKWTVRFLFSKVALSTYEKACCDVPCPVIGWVNHSPTKPPIPLPALAMNVNHALPVSMQFEGILGHYKTKSINVVAWSLLHDVLNKHSKFSFALRCLNRLLRPCMQTCSRLSQIILCTVYGTWMTLTLASPKMWNMTRIENSTKLFNYIQWTPSALLLPTSSWV